MTQSNRRPAKKSKNAAADKQYGKLAQSCNGARLASGLDDSEEQNEQSNRGRVIEQRFAGDEPRQTPRRADFTEDGDHRRRIRRGNNRAEQKTNDDRKLDKRPQRQADRRGSDQRRDDREEQYRGGIFDGPFDIGSNPRLEHKQREKHVDENVGIGRQISKQTSRDIDRMGKAQFCGNSRQDADRHTDRRQHD
jgi:hypothetical protein